MTRRTTETFKKDLILKGFLGACVGVFAFPRIGRVLLRNTRMTSFVNEHFSFSPANPTRIHTRITYAFNHANATHLVFNAAMLWMLGKELVFDPRVNSAHLTTLMTVSAASASFAESSLFATTGSFSRPMVGASGIAMGFLGALAVLDPNKTWLMMFPIPGLTLTSHQMVHHNKCLRRGRRCSLRDCVVDPERDSLRHHGGRTAGDPLQRRARA